MRSGRYIPNGNENVPAGVARSPSFLFRLTPPAPIAARAEPDSQYMDPPRYSMSTCVAASTEGPWPVASTPKTPLKMARRETTRLRRLNSTTAPSMLPGNLTLLNWCRARSSAPCAAAEP